MFAIKQDLLIKALDGLTGVDVVSYGKSRDAFQLPVEVPHWTSGYGGKYEMTHSHVPAGVMVAVGNLEDIDVTDQTKLKAQLKEVDIYPTGHSGDFTGTDLSALQKWFTDRSILDNEVNNQTAISHAKKLTPEGLGRERYDDLVNYLTDNMNLFKDPKANDALVPADHQQREKIVTGLLDGLSKTVRYTRLDDPATIFQLTESVVIEKQAKGDISLNLQEPSKIILDRRYKNGEEDITPLDRAMLGRTWVTADGVPLGNRGSVDLSEIAMRANHIEHPDQPMTTLPYMRPSALAQARL